MSEEGEISNASLKCGADESVSMEEGEVSDEDGVSGMLQDGNSNFILDNFEEIRQTALTNEGQTLEPAYSRRNHDDGGWDLDELPNSSDQDDSEMKYDGDETYWREIMVICIFFCSSSIESTD